MRITLHNNVINQREFAHKILLKPAGDGFDEYRQEYNDMLLDKMQQGQNGITTKKYITITVTAANLELAQQKISAHELAMRTCFQKIGSNIEKLQANQRIRIIADIFRGVNQEIRPINTSQFMRGAEKSLEDLLAKLQERGYEIKRGKHIAVKPTYAERFVRRNGTQLFPPRWWELSLR